MPRHPRLRGDDGPDGAGYVGSGRQCPRGVALDDGSVAFRGIPYAAPPTRYWAAFVRSEDPNVDGVAKWPGYVPERRSLRLTPEGSEVVAGLRAGVCGLLGRP